jgi:hypothetical protein
VRLELRLQSRSEHARLDPGCLADFVDLHDPVEPGQVERHDRLIGAALDAADHGRTAAERHDHRAAGPGPVEHRDHVGAAAGVRDEVRRVVQPAVERAYHIPVRLAVAVRRAGQRVTGEYAVQCGRRVEPGGGQHRIGRYGRDVPVDRHPRPQRSFGQLAARLVVEYLVGPAPPPPGARPLACLWRA